VDIWTYAGQADSCWRRSLKIPPPRVAAATEPPEFFLFVLFLDFRRCHGLSLDLSRRRSASVVNELKVKYAIAPNRLDSFGCGLYAPVASNEAEEGRAKNRRVELVTL
jgi:OOP family OmpA-OmpF porin